MVFAAKERKERKDSGFRSGFLCVPCVLLWQALAKVPRHFAVAGENLASRQRFCFFGSWCVCRKRSQKSQRWRPQSRVSLRSLRSFAAKISWTDTAEADGRKMEPGGPGKPGLPAAHVPRRAVQAGAGGCECVGGGHGLMGRQFIYFLASSVPSGARRVIEAV